MRPSINKVTFFAYIRRAPFGGSLTTAQVQGAEAILGGNRHESTTALLLGSNEEVDEITAKAEAGGGKIHRPAEANEFGMYGSAFDDLDGHLWEVFYMAAPDA